MVENPLNKPLLIIPQYYPGHFRNDIVCLIGLIPLPNLPNQPNTVKFSQTTIHEQ